MPPIQSVRDLPGPYPPKGVPHPRGVRSPSVRFYESVVRISAVVSVTCAAEKNGMFGKTSLVSFFKSNGINTDGSKNRRIIGHFA